MIGAADAAGELPGAGVRRLCRWATHQLAAAVRAHVEMGPKHSPAVANQQKRLAAQPHDEIIARLRDFVLACDAGPFAKEDLLALLRKDRLTEVRRRRQCRAQLIAAKVACAHGNLGPPWVNIGRVYNSAQRGVKCGAERCYPARSVLGRGSAGGFSACCSRSG